MFKRLFPTSGELLDFEFDGQQVSALEGDTIAAALLAAGIESLRNTSTSGSPRAAYCMMGVCYECLVQVNGQAVQACITVVGPGLVVEKLPTVTDSDATD